MKTTRQTAGIYIHIPFCQAKCMYCDFYSVADRNDEIPNFINAICKEINLFFENNEYLQTIDIKNNIFLVNKSKIENVTSHNFINNALFSSAKRYSDFLIEIMMVLSIFYCII